MFFAKSIPSVETRFMGLPLSKGSITQLNPDALVSFRDGEVPCIRWDFASQLGLRFRLPGSRAMAELTMRHWSNGGIRLPNHGQDFATLTIRLNSGLFGINAAHQYPGDPTFNLDHSLAVNESRPAGGLLP